MNNHLDHQQMLAYLDGELSRLENHRAEEHLHSCWTCRTEAEHLKADIATILDSQKEAFSPSLPPPPNAWASFDMLVARSAPVPEAALRLRAMASLDSISGRSWVFAMSLAVILIAVVAFGTFHAPVVSAKEVLRRIEVADAKRSTIAMDQVIRERVRIRRTTRSTGKQESTVANAWRSRKAAYWENPQDDAVIADLEAAYKAHFIALSLPLASSSVSDWGKATHGAPTITRRGTAFDLTYVSANPGSNAIQSVSFLLEPDSWTVKQMTLALPNAFFEVTEEDFDVVPANSVSPILRAQLELAPFPSAAPPATIDPVALPTNEAGVHSPINLDSAEIAVFTTLHHLKVDLGEPVTVVRTQGGVEVGIWQLPEDRQEELRSALSGQPGVQILTSAPHVSVVKISPSSPQPSRPALVTADSETDDRLIKFFGGADKEQEFTQRVLNTSTDMLSHLYALRGLQAEFPTATEERLSREDRSRLAVLVQDHAEAIRSNLDTLATQLLPLDNRFGVAQSPMPASSLGIAWQQGSLDSLQAGKAIDHLLRALLTTSEDPATPDKALPEIGQNISRLGAKLGALSVAVQ
jgi:anti-sigma factor RsiW